MDTAILLQTATPTEALQRDVYVPLRIAKMLSGMAHLEIRLFILVVALLEPEATGFQAIDIPASLIQAVFGIKKESLGDWLDERADSLATRIVKEVEPDGSHDRWPVITRARYIRAEHKDNPHGFPIFRMQLHEETVKELAGFVRKYGHRLELYRNLKTVSGLQLLIISMAHLKNSLHVTFTMPLNEFQSLVAGSSNYKRYNDYRRFVLGPAADDINKRSPLCNIKATGVANGRGKAITDIEISFSVSQGEEHEPITQSDTVAFLIKNGIRQVDALKVLSDLGEQELRKRIDEYERDSMAGKIEQDIKDGKVKSYLHRLRATLKGSYIAAPQNEHDRALIERTETTRIAVSTHRAAKMDELTKRRDAITRQLDGMRMKYYGELLNIADAELADDERADIRKRVLPAYLNEFDQHGIAFPLRAPSNVSQRIEHVHFKIACMPPTIRAMERVSQSVLGVRNISEFYIEQGVSKYASLADELASVQREIKDTETQGELEI